MKAVINNLEWWVFKGNGCLAHGSGGKLEAISSRLPLFGNKGGYTAWAACVIPYAFECKVNIRSHAHFKQFTEAKRLYFHAKTADVEIEFETICASINAFTRIARFVSVGTATIIKGL